MRELNACGDRVSRVRYAESAVIVEARIPLLQWWECQSYYKMYIAANRAHTAELIDNIKVASGLKHNVLDDTTKGQESLSRVLYDYVDDAYYRWLAGEMSTKEFAGLVAAIAKSAIKAEDEVKEAMK